VTFKGGKCDELLCMAELSLEGCGTWGKAVYAGTFLKCAQIPKKPVTYMFNILILSQF
jgi:hypothetical protein